MKLKHICIALLCVLLQTNTHATHIVNGNLSAYILKEEADRFFKEVQEQQLEKSKQIITPGQMATDPMFVPGTIPFNPNLK